VPLVSGTPGKAAERCIAMRLAETAGAHRDAFIHAQAPLEHTCSPPCQNVEKRPGARWRGGLRSRIPSRHDFS
jgi:hypothetical protein